MRLMNMKQHPISRRHWFILFSVVCIALFLRLFHLGTIPLGFHVDELDAGYIGRYIFTHGRDVYGHIFPLVFDKFGDFRPTGIFYLSGLSVLLFGNHECAVRLPSAVIGAFTVVALWYFVLVFFKNRIVALGAAAALAIMPWHIVLSRSTSEGIVGLFLVILGFGLIQSAMLPFSKPRLIKGFILLWLSYLFYHSFRLLVPVFLLPFLFMDKASFKPQKMMISLWIVSFLLSILCIATTGISRMNQVVLWKNQSIVDTQIILRSIDGGARGLTTAVFHSNVVLYTREFLTQYLSYFSPDFLFIKGGLPERYVVPHQGLLLLVFLPFLFIGIGTIILSRTPARSKLFLLVWMLLAPLPGALTFEDTPNIHRAIALIVPLAICIGWGIDTIGIWISKAKRILAGFIVAVIIVFTGFEIAYFFHEYEYHTPAYKSVFRNQGVREMIMYIFSHKDTYDTVIVPNINEYALYYAFYKGIYREIVPGTFRWKLEADTIDSINFVGMECPSIHFNRELLIGKRVLFVGEGNCPDSLTPIVKEITRRDGTKAFEIRELLPRTQ
jgi:4-amino-4-deoxy-L-arabinose transferase-like glycosyltransferase